MAKKLTLPALLAAAALGFHLFAGFSFIRSAAATYDETVHLASGFSYLRTGRYVMNIMDHPPLSELLSAAAVLPLGPQAFTGHPYFANFMPYHYGDLFLYNNSVPHGRLLNTARGFTFLLWTALLAGLLWLALSRLESKEAAAYALCVYAGLPAFISNNALVTTDSAAAAFLFAACALGWLAAAAPAPAKGRASLPPTAWAALAGLAAGLGMASKFSMFVAPPLLLALWAADEYFFGAKKFKRLAAPALACLGACLLALALVYKFDLGLYWEGLSATLKRLDQGRSSFILGRHSIEGVWWYFPAAVLLKTPLIALLAALAGAAIALRKAPRAALWLLAPAALFFAASLNSKVQIGYRHVLPVMPFLAALAGLGLARIAGSSPRRAWLAALLAALVPVSAAAAHPHYLAYFNQLAGGPANGYKSLVDSNLDWGQALPQLADHLKGRGNPPIIFSYFGVARPEAYGIAYAPLGLITNAGLVGTGAQVCGMKEVLLAVSATNLQSTYYADKRTYDWLRERRPAFAAGHAIFLYDLTADGPGLEALAALFDREGRNAEADCLYGRAGALKK